ncbi:MAG: hypothetical protein WAL98_08670 [Desulfatiglandaceae bacterium]
MDETYKVFLSVLEVNGFTTVPAGKVIKIIKASEARGKGVETVFGKGIRSTADNIITQLYPMKTECESGESGYRTGTGILPISRCCLDEQARAQTIVI